MHILLAQNSLYYPSHGGGDKSNRLLMEALAGTGHTCRVVSRLGGFGGDEHERFLADLARRSVPVFLDGPRVVVFRHREVEVHVVLHPRETSALFADQIGTFAPEVILTSTDDPAQLLLEAALKAAGPRVVYLARATLAVPFGPDCAFPSAAKTEMLRRVDGVVGVSQYVADYVRRWGGIDAVHVPISLLEPGPYPSLGRFDNEFVTLVNPCAVKGISIFLALAERMPAVHFAAVPTWGTNREDIQALHRHPNVAVLSPWMTSTGSWRARACSWCRRCGPKRARASSPRRCCAASPCWRRTSAAFRRPCWAWTTCFPCGPSPATARTGRSMVPVAEVPEQDIGPWQAALDRLLTDARTTSSFPGSPARGPWPTPRASAWSPSRRTWSGSCSRPASRGSASGTSSIAARELSPEKRRLLALRLRKKPRESREPAPWFPSIDATGAAALRLFCFPFAGAGTSAFRGWTGSLPASVGVCPVRLPGRESRLAEVPFRHMEPLVRALAEAILPYLDRPFAFFGHSMGAAIAFELTRLLRREDRPIPAALLVSGARAPHFRLGHVPPPEPTEEEFLRDLERLEGIPPEVRRNPDLLRVVLPALLADTALYRGYVYREEPPLDCPILAYGGAADPNVRREHLEAWRNETTGAFSLRIFPGGHFFIDSARPEFLAALSEDL